MEKDNVISLASESEEEMTGIDYVAGAMDVFAEKLENEWSGIEAVVVMASVDGELDAVFSENLDVDAVAMMANKLNIRFTLFSEGWDDE